MAGNRTERRGSGPTPAAPKITPEAAAILRELTTGARNGKPYNRTIAGDSLSRLLERHGRREFIHITPAMLAALPRIEQARQQCFDEEAQRGLDALIAALWVAKNE